jgi:uncharacterized delta-60 repeat protein
LKNIFLTLLSTAPSKIAALAVLTLALFISSNVRAASPGALDLSFSDRGTAAFALGTDFQRSYSLAIQADGKVLVAGYIQNCSGTCTFDFLVVRYNTDGTLDSGFGTGGVVKTDNANQDEAAYTMAVQADGKIVVAGGSLGGTPSATNVFGFKLVRYLTDGTLDPSFGSGGRVYESFNDMGGTPQSILIQSDGKIVVAGSDQTTQWLFVARFNTNGLVDTGFANNGRIATNTYPSFDVRLAQQSSGKLILTTRSLPVGAVKILRFDTAGVLDVTFGASGVLTCYFNIATIPAIAVQPDDKILLSGQPFGFNDHYVPPLIRFHVDGVIDTSLVPNHGPTLPQGNTCARCTQRVAKILMMPDGRFYLVGTYRSSRTEMAVSRYSPTGSLDYSFGFRGTILVRHRNLITEAPLNGVGDAAIQADGKVLITATHNSIRQFFTTRVTAGVTSPHMRADFDGDHKTDFAIFRPSNRFWYVKCSTNGLLYQDRYGAQGDVILPGDFNYDARDDLSVYRADDTGWYIAPSLPSGGGNPGGPFGQQGDTIVPEDYDGDGFTDLAVFRPSNGLWTIRYSNNPSYPTATAVDVSFTWGSANDTPVPGDYDGDGRADLAVFRRSAASWYILRSSDGLVTALHFGLSTDQLVPADYDGDLKTDIAVFRGGSWYILRSSDGVLVGVTWGSSTDRAVPGDYDGDGKFDAAIYRPSEGGWYVLRSSDSVFVAQTWGLNDDVPIPTFFVK